MPTSTTIDYAAQVDIQHYIVPMRMSSIVLEDAATAAANNGATLSTWLNTANALSGIKAVTFDEDPFVIFIESATFTVSNVALASNVVTVTTTAAHGLVVGGGVKVDATTNTAVNGIFTVKAAPTTTTFTYDLVGANITSGADTGSVKTGAYPLDGTGKPIQLLNVTGAPLSGQTNDETVITHDAETRGSTVTVGVSNTFSAAYKGMTVHKSVDHKILELLNTYSVSESLGFKWLRVGPSGTNEKKLCYGRLSSLTEEGDAGALAKYGFNMNVQGRVYTIFDNA
jgi:hypothetical protein